MYTKRHLLLYILILISILILLTTSSLLISSLSSTRIITPYPTSPSSPFPFQLHPSKNKKSKYNPTAWFPAFLQSKPATEWYPDHQLETFNTALRQTTLPLPEHDRVRGFAILDRLYLKDGLMYLVTTDRNIADMGGIAGEKLKIITPQEAKQVLGDYIIPINGISFIFFDDPTFMKDYQNWWTHLILGSMRVYSSLSLIKAEKTPLSEPTRFLLPSSPSNSWRDPSSLNAPLMRAAFPSSPIEGTEAWADLQDTGRAYVWERAMLVDMTSTSPIITTSPTRSTHIITPLSPHLLPPPPLAFWSALRHRTTHNILGYLPVLDPWGRLYLNSVPSEMRQGMEEERRRRGGAAVQDTNPGDLDLGADGDHLAGAAGSGPLGGIPSTHPTHPQPTLLPLITLLSTQSSPHPSTRFNKACYRALKAELRRMEWVGLIRFREVEVGADGEFIYSPSGGPGKGKGKGGKGKAMRAGMGVMAESAILISAHGRGLINQLWMPSTTRSSIIEIFYPGVFDPRYEVLARNVGHTHYTIWNTTHITYPQISIPNDSDAAAAAAAEELKAKQYHRIKRDQRRLITREGDHDHPPAVGAGAGAVKQPVVKPGAKVLPGRIGKPVGGGGAQPGGGAKPGGGAQPGGGAKPGGGGAQPGGGGAKLPGGADKIPAAAVAVKPGIKIPPVKNGAGGGAAVKPVFKPPIKPAVKPPIKPAAKPAAKPDPKPPQPLAKPDPNPPQPPSKPPQPPSKPPQPPSKPPQPPSKPPQPDLKIAAAARKPPPIKIPIKAPIKAPIKIPIKADTIAFPPPVNVPVIPFEEESEVASEDDVVPVDGGDVEGGDVEGGDAEGGGGGDDDDDDDDDLESIPVSSAAVVQLVKEILARKLNEDEEDVVYKR